MPETAPLTPLWLGIAGMLADSAFETDAAGRFTAFGAADMLGYKAGNLLGSLAAQVFATPDDVFAGIFTAVCRDFLVWQGAIPLRHADETYGTYRLALAPKLDRRGRIAGTYGLLIDLSASELSGTGAGEGLDIDKILDPETGLWSAASFTEQAARRFDRLDVESQPGTLLFLGFARVKPRLQAPTAVRLAEELRDIVRPTDLLGRIDRTTVALWCDGMDHLTGAERAAKLCRQLPAALPGKTMISVGLVTRWPGSADDPVSLVERAGHALAEADLAAGQDVNGTWRVWQPPP